MSALLQEPEIVLRPMRETDVPTVLAIEERVAITPWTEGIFSGCIGVGYSCWVCTDDDEVVGFGVLSYGSGEAHILNIAIDSPAQGKGLGRRMMRHLLEQAESYGAETTFLEVRPSNKNAVGLYESLGFNQVGLRREYYPTRDKGREDALILAISGFTETL
ncbi:MAG: ribosomal protein S18-alanine N-acetyltransferase [Gammaproteobacteria bacterium]|nr:ribosomal protein S18-alanine N-acetyltransferase [Gammaproteobacteria bacterium]